VGGCGGFGGWLGWWAREVGGSFPGRGGTTALLVIETSDCTSVDKPQKVKESTYTQKLRSGNSRREKRVLKGELCFGKYLYQATPMSSEPTQEG